MFLVDNFRKFPKQIFAWREAIIKKKSSKIGELIFVYFLVHIHIQFEKKYNRKRAMKF